MKTTVDTTVKALLLEKIKEIESHFNCDVLTYYGPIQRGMERTILRIIENLATDEAKKDNLVVILTTGGGSAETVERYVNIIRQHYKEVSFIVPDYAYSAGTIFCMSGDHIYMDYFSVLGPIDPQVENKEGKLVAALGYLDKINELLEKARKKEITQAEFLILKDFDLAELKEYEQAKELTIDLLKKWLVKYKFKNWETHSSTPELIGKSVSLQEKEKRAEDIADKLSNNKLWKSHGRPINKDILSQDLKLKIEDYSKDIDKRQLIRSYYDLVSDYVVKNKISIFVQTRKT